MLRILLIDDDNEVRRIMVAILTAAGHDVVEANGGAVGVAIFARQPIDLVITDMVMPGQNGTDTILQIRVLRPDARIIAISGAPPASLPEMAGVPQIDVLDTANELDVNAILGKPFRRHELVALVASLLGDGVMQHAPATIAGG